MIRKCNARKNGECFDKRIQTELGCHLESRKLLLLCFQKITKFMSVNSSFLSSYHVIFSTVEISNLENNFNLYGNKEFILNAISKKSKNTVGVICKTHTSLD